MREAGYPNLYVKVANQFILDLIGKVSRDLRETHKEMTKRQRRADQCEHFR